MEWATVARDGRGPRVSGALYNPSLPRVRPAWGPAGAPSGRDSRPHCPHPHAHHHRHHPHLHRRHCPRRHRPLHSLRRPSRHRPRHPPHPLRHRHSLPPPSPPPSSPPPPSPPPSPPPPSPPPLPPPSPPPHLRLTASAITSPHAATITPALPPAALAAATLTPPSPPPPWAFVPHKKAPSVNRTLRGPRSPLRETEGPIDRPDCPRAAISQLLADPWRGSAGRGRSGRPEERRSF